KAGRAVEDAAGRKEGASHPRGVPGRFEPRLGIVRGRREVDVDSRLVERGARELHAVLPADETADLPQTGVDRLQAAPVAESPDHALVIRGHQLAMVDRELAVGREDEQRVVERAALELVDADGED